MDELLLIILRNQGLIIQLLSQNSEIKNKNEVYEYGKKTIDRVNEYFKPKGDSENDSNA